MIDVRVVAQAISTRLDKTYMPRKATQSDIDDLEAFIATEAPKPPTTTERVHELEDDEFVPSPAKDSLGIFKELRAIISASPKRDQCSAIFNGRYRSGVFSADGREALYPFLGARRIYPDMKMSVRDKLDFVESLLPSSESQTNLLPVDLSKLAMAAGVVLPHELQPEQVKSALLGGTSDIITSTNNDW